MHKNILKYYSILFTLILISCQKSSINNDLIKYRQNYLQQKVTNKGSLDFIKFIENKSPLFEEDKYITFLLSHINQHPSEWLCFTKYLNENSIPRIDEYLELKYGQSKQYEKIIKEFRSIQKKCNATYMSSFKFQNRLDKTININEFKGKFLVIDLWSTWCKACLMYDPHFFKIVEKYQNDSSIVFISLAVHQNPEKWITYLNEKREKIYKNHIDGIIANEIDLYNFNNSISSLSIPKYIFINEFGEIKYSNGPKPTNSEFLEILEKLK